MTLQQAAFARIGSPPRRTARYHECNMRLRLFRLPLQGDSKSGASSEIWLCKGSLLLGVGNQLAMRR